MPFTFRKITLQDLPQVISLFQAAFASSPWKEDWTKCQARTRIEEYLSSPLTKTLAIVEENEIIGCCIGHQQTYLDYQQFTVDEFFVSPTKQNEGIGSLLMNQLKEELKADDVKQILLCSEKGYPCIDFYQKNGITESKHMIVLEENL